MRTLTGFAVNSLNSPSGHPRKKLSKALDIKISLTHLFPGLQTSGRSPRLPGQFHMCLLPVRPGRRHVSGNACGMNKGYPAMVCPKKGHRSNPPAAIGLSSTLGHATSLTQDGTQKQPSQLSLSLLHPWACHTTHTYSPSRPAQS